MGKILVRFLVTAGVGFCLLQLSQAHHSFIAVDPNIERLMTGTVTQWSFNNPHSWLYLDVENEDGTTTLWSFEGSAPISLLGKRITGDTFQPGDRITFMYCPLKDGRPGGHLGWAQLGDGSFINPSDGGCAGDEETIARWKEWLEQGFTSKAEAEEAGAVL